MKNSAASSTRIRIALLGATGSIGDSTLRVLRARPDLFELTLVAAKSNVRKLAAAVHEFHVPHAVLADKTQLDGLRSLLPNSTQIHSDDNLCELVASDSVDVVLCAIVGTGGLGPVLSAIRASKRIALASKEVLVMAGDLVMNLAEQFKAAILPVDSEHSALFRCLQGHRPDDIAELILTASGGPFRGKNAGELNAVTWADAMRHPVWSMGPKVTIDSATMMNKALELIEASRLFRTPETRIRVLIHPQSIVHSMVRLADGAVLSLMSVPDMRFPIQYALTWPRHIESGLPQLDLATIKSLSFEDPDERTFPSIRLAREALRRGGTAPTVLNAANEAAVERFRLGEIRLPQIWNILEKTLSAHTEIPVTDLSPIQEADRWARNFAKSIHP